jgi:hypothetical protein
MWRCIAVSLTINPELSPPQVPSASAPSETAIVVLDDEQEMTTAAAAPITIAVTRLNETPTTISSALEVYVRPTRLERLRSLFGREDLVEGTRAELSSVTPRPPWRTGMRALPSIVTGLILSTTLGTPAIAQSGGGAPSTAPADSTPDPIKVAVARLDLEKYKATIKGLTQFGDRRQGTKRNRDAVDWIEAQLKSYGCTNTERITYDYQPAPRDTTGRGRGAGAGGRGGAARTGRGAAQGGGTPRGIRARTGVNNDSLAQPDPVLRALDTKATVPGQRQEVYCTKVGTTHPNEMYIVSGHMDGLGYSEAANDNGSGAALVMELARILSAPDVQTDRSIRFVLWNNEETGLNGAAAYVTQRAAR